MDLQFHEITEWFPLLDEQALQELAADIRTNGLLEPIALYEGKVLDGRNRYQACKLAGVTPETRDVQPQDPVQFAVSRNLHRRHLEVSQRAMIAAKAKDYYAAQAKARQEAGKRTPEVVETSTRGQVSVNGKARDQAGAAARVSGRTVDKAARVRKEGIPALGKLVEAGSLDVTTAAKIAGLPKDAQDTLLEDAKRNDYSPRMMREEVKRLSPKPPEPPRKMKKADSPALQELKSAWKKAGKEDRKAFLEWVHA